MENGKSLKEKMLFLMCLGALAGNMSTEVYAQGNEICDEHCILGQNLQMPNVIISSSTEKKNGILIEGDGNGNGGSIFFEKVEIKKNNSESSIHIKVSGNKKGIATFKEKLIVTNKLGYALYSNSSSDSGLSSTILIAGIENETKNKIQIIGNLKAQSVAKEDSGKGTAISSIKLNLNNKESFFAGKMETEARTYINKDKKALSKAIIELNLKNEATWYPHFNKNDTYTIDGSHGEFETEKINRVENLVRRNSGIGVTSNGGVIDIYNYTPDKTRIDFSESLKEELNSLESGLDEISKLDEFTEEVYLELKQKLPEENMEELEGIIANLSGETNEKIFEGVKKYLDNFVKKEINIKKEEIEKIKLGVGERTFILDKVGKINIPVRDEDGNITTDENGNLITKEHKNNLPNTTFRISSNVEKGKADKIVFTNATIEGSETYHIQIAADPFKGEEWKADENNKIYVMDIENRGNGQIDVIGKEYTKETGAGLVEQIITPTIKKDDKNTEADKEKWYLASIDKVENKGSGHIFAEIGAAANAGMASAWRTDSGDLYQRMGNLRNNEAEQGVWGRIYTGENEVRKGIGLDLEYRAVQVGYDRKENIDGGKLFTGIAFGYFDGNADYDHGSGESNSATVGLYATYLGTNGSYGDFIVKLGNIDNELSYSSESGDYYKADYDTYGFSADAEYGYRYEFNNDYYIEPLAQLSYIYIDGEEYTMNLNGESGARVSNDTYQSLIGYAGFHYGKNFGDSTAYLRLVAAHEFAGDIDVDARYQDVKVNSSISGEDTWVEYGVGFDVKVKEDTAVYGRLQRSTGDVVRNKWHASVGIRYTF